MKKQIFLKLSILSIFCLVVSGCLFRSAPVRYYKLSAGTLGKLPGPVPEIGSVTVEIPAYLKRQQLVFQRDKHEIGFLEKDRWGCMLRKDMADVLQYDFEQQTNCKDLKDVKQGHDSALGEVQLRYVFRSFSGDLNGNFRVNGICYIVQNPLKIHRSFCFRFVLPFTVKKVPSLVEAHNLALARIAGETVDYLAQQSWK